jgi:hypothetical protein
MFSKNGSNQKKKVLNWEKMDQTKNDSNQILNVQQKLFEPEIYGSNRNITRITSFVWTCLLIPI